MAAVGQWTGGAKSQGNLPETWTAPTSLFDTEDANPGSIYSWAASTSTLTLPSSDLADGYLLIGYYQYEDTSNGRFNPQGRFIQASGTGDFVTGTTSGYNRDTSEDRSYVRTWAFIRNPSASATIQFQWKADADDSTGGTAESVLQVVPFYFSNIGMYESTSAALYGGTTPNQVTGWSVVHESDTAAIELASNEIDTKGSGKRYLILGSQFYEGRGGRTQRWKGLRLGGTKADHSKAYTYYRNTSNDEGGEFYTHLLEGAQTIDHFCYRGDGVSAGQGGADVDGSTPSVGAHACVVIELNDSAEVFAARHISESADLNVTGPVDLNMFEVSGIDLEDTGSFSRVSNTGMEAQSDFDLLMGADLSAAQEVVSVTSRWTAYGQLTLDGTEQSISRAGDYARNNQSSQDTFGWSANLLTAGPVTNGQDIGVSIQELAGGEDGGEYRIQAGWAGMWGINLDTLEATGGTVDLAGSGASASDGSGDLGVTRGLVGSGPSASDGTGDLTVDTPVTVAELQVSGFRIDLKYTPSTAGTVDLSGSGASSSAGTGALSVMVPLSGSGPNASDGQGSIDLTRGVAGAGPTASDGSGSIDVFVPLDGAGPNTSDGVGSLSVTAVLSGTGASVSHGVGVLSPTRGLDGSGASSSEGRGVLSPTREISGAGPNSSDGTGALEVTANLSGSGANSSDGQGTVAVTRGISGDGPAASEGQAALSVTRDLAGAGASVSYGRGDLPVLKALVGAGGNVSAGSGDMAVAVDLTGSGAGVSDGTGVLDVAGQIDLAGAGPNSSDGSGSLVLQLSLAGSGPATGAGAGVLSPLRGIAGAGSASSSGSGDLPVSKPLAGSGPNASEGQGSIDVTRGLGGAGASVSDGIGTLDVEAEIIDLSGAGASSSDGVGSLAVTRDLTGAGPNASDGRGLLEGGVPLAGSGGNASDGSGALDVMVPIAGAGAAASAGQATLGVRRGLVGAGPNSSAGAAQTAFVRGMVASGASASDGFAALALTLDLLGAGAATSDGLGILRVIGSGGWWDKDPTDFDGDTVPYTSDPAPYSKTPVAASKDPAPHQKIPHDAQWP